MWVVGLGIATAKEGLWFRESLAESLGSDYMHDSRRDSLRDSFFLRGKTNLTINIFNNIVYYPKHWKHFTHQLLQSRHYTNSWPVCLSIYFNRVQNKIRTTEMLWQRILEQRIVVRMRDMLKTLQGSIRIICHIDSNPVLFNILMHSLSIF